MQTTKDSIADDASLSANVRKNRQNAWLTRLKRNGWTYLLLFPGLLYFLLFYYLPLLGNVVAFQDYSPYLGILRSPWSGLDNLVSIFSDPAIGTVIVNTLVISSLQIVFAFPIGIVLSLMLNALIHDRFKRFMQSVLYLPHFLGWVIIISIWQQVFGGDGLVNHFIVGLGGHPVNIMTNPDFFKPLVVLQVIWKETGWSTILFLAAITAIDSSLYEAAVVDGAGKWRRMWHITLPGIRGVIVLLLILRIGNILSTGFEQIFLQRNAVGLNAAEVIDTFVYDRGIINGSWGVAAAIALVKTVIGAILVYGANRIAKRLGEEGPLLMTWDKSSGLGQTILWVIMIILAIAMLFPFVYVIAVSFSSYKDAVSNNLLIIPLHPTLQAYSWVLKNGGVLLGLGVSLFSSTVGTVVSMFLSVTLAYALSRREVPGIKVALWLVLLTLLITPSIITKFLVVRQLGMIDTLWALILPSALNPFNVIVMRQFFISIPTELIDSARLDGANDWHILWRIMLPLSKASLAAIGLFYAVANWNSFFEPTIYLNNPQLYPVAVILRMIVLQSTMPTEALSPGQTPPPDLTLQMAVVVLATLPILLIYPFLQRYFTKGVLTGSIKG